MHKGGGSPSCGGGAAAMRDSVFGWRAACQRRGGDAPAPAFPPRGKPGRGRLDSSLSQPIRITPLSFRDPSAVLYRAPSLAAPATARAPTALLGVAQTEPPQSRPVARTLERCNPPV